MNASDYAFKAILTWTRAAHAEGFSFQPKGGKTRRRNVERLFAMMTNATQLLPMVQTVAVPHVPSCDVITFDFVPQLLTLLQNQTIMTQDNYRTQVLMVLEVKLCLAKGIKMRIKALTPILNVNCLSQLYNGLNVPVSLGMIDSR